LDLSLSLNLGLRLGWAWDLRLGEFEFGLGLNLAWVRPWYRKKTFPSSKCGSVGWLLASLLSGVGDLFLGMAL
jgi:hypothetical protein